MRGSYPLSAIWAPALKLKVFPFQQPDFSPFSFFSHVPIVVPLWMRWRVYVCVGVQACACVHVRMRACLSNLIFFFSLYVCEADVKACAFSLASLLCSAPARSERGENKRGRRGGESAPTVDLAIVRSRNTIPIDAVDARLKPPEALGRGLIQSLMWPAGMGAKMGVQAIVEMVGILFLLCCFNITEISSKSSINT